jgi:hypothetical protein
VFAIANSHAESTANNLLGTILSIVGPFDCYFPAIARRFVSGKRDGRKDIRVVLGDPAVAASAFLARGLKDLPILYSIVSPSIAGLIDYFSCSTISQYFKFEYCEIHFFCDINGDSSLSFRDVLTMIKKCLLH